MRIQRAYGIDTDGACNCGVWPGRRVPLVLSSPRRRASSDASEVPLDLVTFHRGVLCHDFLQQQPQLRNVPLAITERLNQWP